MEGKREEKFSPARGWTSARGSLGFQAEKIEAVEVVEVALERHEP